MDATPEMLDAARAGRAGEVIRLARRRLGISQAQLAATIGYSQAAVSRIERERGVNAHDVRTLRTLAGALSIPAHLLGISEPRDLKEDPVHRRDFLGLTTALALAAHDRSGSRRVGRAEVSEIQQALDDLRSLDQRFGGDQLQRLAGLQVRRARDLLANSHYGPDAGRALSALLGESSILAGWLAFDSGNHSAAARLYSDGLSAAEEARDDLVAAHAYANLSMLATASGRPDHAVRFAQAGQRAATLQGGPRLRSRLIAREAQGHGGMMNAPATNNAVARAEHAFAGDDGQDPGWTAFFVEAEFAGVAGSAFRMLGDVDRSMRDLRTAAELEGRPRNRASWILQLAGAHVDAGDAAQGCEVAGAVIPTVRDMTSARLRQQLCRLARSTAAHGACAEVRHFRACVAGHGLAS